MIYILVIIALMIGQYIYLHMIIRRLTIMAETIASLTQKVTDLKTASDARELRDIAQDAVTTEQIRVLTEQITALQAIIAAGGISPENQALLDTAVANISSVIDSLNAADPTPPVVP
jgi:hypothetical protein